MDGPTDRRPANITTLEVTFDDGRLDAQRRASRRSAGGRGAAPPTVGGQADRGLEQGLPRRPGRPQSTGQPVAIPGRPRAGAGSAVEPVVVLRIRAAERW